MTSHSLEPAPFCSRRFTPAACFLHPGAVLLAASACRAPHLPAPSHMGSIEVQLSLPSRAPWASCQGSPEQVLSTARHLLAHLLGLGWTLLQCNCVPTHCGSHLFGSTTISGTSCALAWHGAIDRWPLSPGIHELLGGLVTLLPGESSLPRERPP